MDVSFHVAARDRLFVVLYNRQVVPQRGLETNTATAQVLNHHMAIQTSHEMNDESADSIAIVKSPDAEENLDETESNKKSNAIDENDTEKTSTETQLNREQVMPKEGDIDVVAEDNDKSGVHVPDDVINPEQRKRPREEEEENDGNDDVEPETSRQRVDDKKVPNNADGVVDPASVTVNPNAVDPNQQFGMNAFPMGGVPGVQGDQAAQLAMIQQQLMAKGADVDTPAALGGGQRQNMPRIDPRNNPIINQTMREMQLAQFGMAGIPDNFFLNQQLIMGGLPFGGQGQLPPGFGPNPAALSTHQSFSMANLLPDQRRFPLLAKQQQQQPLQTQGGPQQQQQQQAVPPAGGANGGMDNGTAPHGSDNTEGQPPNVAAGAGEVAPAPQTDQPQQMLQGNTDASVPPAPAGATIPGGNPADPSAMSLQGLAGRPGMIQDMGAFGGLPFPQMIFPRGAAGMADPQGRNRMPFGGPGGIHGAAGGGYRPSFLVAAGMQGGIGAHGRLNENTSAGLRGLANLAPQTPAISLSLACDDEHLSEYQILVRKQLEIFEAQPEDAESNTQGRKKQVSLGQVGIRCKHCASLPQRQRGRGAVYYPAKLQGVYQAAQNMASSHLCESCQCIDESLKKELKTLRERRDTASGGKQYWADGARALGLFEAEDGLRMSRDQ